MSKKKLFFIAIAVSLGIGIICWLISLLWDGLGRMMTNIVATIFFLALSALIGYVHYVMYIKQQYPKHALAGIIITTIAFLFLFFDIWFPTILQGAFLVNLELLLLIVTLVFLHNALLLRIAIVDIHVRYLQIGTMICAAFIGLDLIILPNIYWYNIALFFLQFALLIGVCLVLLDVAGIVLTVVLNHIMKHEKH